jgi:hypothetical protein
MPGGPEVEAGRHFVGDRDDATLWMRSAARRASDG